MLACYKQDGNFPYDHKKTATYQEYISPLSCPPPYQQALGGHIVCIAFLGIVFYSSQDASNISLKNHELQLY